MAALMLAKKLMDKGGNPAPSPVAPTAKPIDVTPSSKVPTREVSRRDTKKKAKKSTDTGSLLGGSYTTMGGA